MFPIFKHATLEERRIKLKAESVPKFLKLKARRYAMFRVQNFLEGGAPPDPEHVRLASEVADAVESLGGVQEFAKLWDFDPLTGDVVCRDCSVWDAHEKAVQRGS